MTRTITELENLYKTLPAGGYLVLTEEERDLWEKYHSIIKAANVREGQQPSIAEVLAERGSRYGPFAGHASLTQDIKNAMKGKKGHGAAYGSKWEQLSDSQKEALEMIAHKIGRILNGNPNYLDSWVDIIGYTQLVVDELNAMPKEIAK